MPGCVPRDTIGDDVIIVLRNTSVTCESRVSRKAVGREVTQYTTTTTACNTSVKGGNIVYICVCVCICVYMRVCACVCACMITSN